MVINKRLEELRTQSGLSQSQLAKILGIGQSTIAGYENQEFEPKISILIAYADFFKCSLDYLAGRESETGEPVYAGEAISAEESSLLAAYRALSPSMRRMLIDYAKMLKNHN